MNKKENKKITRILWIIGITFVAILLFQYIALFRSIDKPDITQDPFISENIYKHVQYNEHDQKLVFDLPYEMINALLNNSPQIINTTNDKISIQDLTIDSKTKHLFGKLILSPNRSIDFSTTFDLTLVNDTLVFTINKMQLGQSNPYLSQLIFQLHYDFDTITVPLNTSSDDLIATYIKAYYKDVPIELIQSEKGFKQTFDNNLIYASQLYPLSEVPDIFNYPVHTESEEEYIELSQLQLAITALKSSDFLALFHQNNYNAELFTNTADDIILRISSIEKNISIDLNLIFNIDITSGNSLQLKLDHIQTPLGKNIEITNALFEKAIQSSLNAFDSKHFDQYHIVRSALNLTHLHLYFEQSSWTIMVYMIGSDLESGFNFYDNSLNGNASTDLEEMMKGHKSENVHVVVETGGTKNWKLKNIQPGINQRWEINNSKMNLIESLERKNMSDQETLYSFTSWAIDTYPADKYALIFWNHGGGSLYGFGLDEYYPEDSLTLDEMNSALERVTHEHNALFEVVGFDACLMATLETAAILEPYTNYLIASEETEPDSGWDYERILSQLEDGEAYNGKSFGEIVVSGFFDASIDENKDGLLTLSVIDLKVIPTVIQRMNKLFDSVIETHQLNTLSKTIPQVKAFGGNTQLTGYTDHYDIENFAKRSLEFLPSESNRLLAAIDDAVIYKANGYLTTDAGGLSFYLPFYDLEKNKNLTDLYTRVAFSESYNSFVKQFVNFRLSNSVSSTMIPYTLYKENRPYQLQITEGFEHLVSDIYLGVSAFEHRSDGEYRLNLGYDSWIYEGFEKGLYEESFGFWPAINNTYLPISVVYNGDDYIEYETPVLLNNEPIMMITAWLYNEERYITVGGRPIITNEGLTDRNTIEFEDGDQIDILYSYYNKSTDQWSEEIATSLTYNRASAFVILNKSLKENQEYGISFIIKDLNGTLSYTDMIRFIYEQ